jgi:hypothetical protein
MKKWKWIAICALLAPVSAVAQGTPSNAVSAAAKRVLDPYAKDLVGTAETMPAEKYSYRPTPEEMPFGKTIAHIAEVNNFSCSKFSDVPVPDGPKITENDSKDKLVAGLKASLDYCSQTLAKLDDAKMSETISFFGGRPATRAVAVFELIDDLADHYGALSVYLRLNALLPPSAQPKK